jgi:hypothetical protein
MATMTINEFRKLNRRQLTEMLVEQSKQIEMLKGQLKAAETKLEERDIKINEAGNIAEAALRLNRVFEDAQAASEQYVFSLRALYAREHEICRQMEERMTGEPDGDIPDNEAKPESEENGSE